MNLKHRTCLFYETFFLVMKCEAFSNYNLESLFTLKVLCGNFFGPKKRIYYNGVRDKRKTCYFLNEMHTILFKKILVWNLSNGWESLVRVVLQSNRVSFVFNSARIIFLLVRCVFIQLLYSHNRNCLFVC